LTDTFMILIADRNPHIRQFLRRELVAEGYRVLVARDGRDVQIILNGNESPDLLILDLHIPNVDGLQILEWLKDHDRFMPVIVHTYHTEYANHPAVREAAAFFEKTGNNIDSFKAVAAGVLRKWYPDRFECLEKPDYVMTEQDH
jgi:DNA-binding response OmpR family regulator